MKKTRKLPSWMTDDDTVSPSQEKFSFPGHVDYITSVVQCDEVCYQLLGQLSSSPNSGGHRVAWGFDTEWPVSYGAAAKDETAVIQLCTGVDRVIVFHLSAMSPVAAFPESLSALIADTRALKVGLNIEADFWKLGRDFDLDVVPIIRDATGLCDLAALGQKVLRTAERWSLAGLVCHLVDKELSKDSGVRLAAWNQVPLSRQQLEYAATDAYASWLVYKILNDRKVLMAV